MRVAVIVAAVLVVTTPSEASKSCMTKAEARQHFGSVHLYWHGPNHCWDATSTRRYAANRVQRKKAIREVKPRADQPKWQDSMSEMLVDTAPAQPLRTLASMEARRDVNDGALGAMPWIDRWSDVESSPVAARWVDIAPVERPSVIERKAERVVRPQGVVLLFVVFVLLALGTIEVLVRWTFYEARGGLAARPP
jgi:hypothetical protein